MVSGGFDWNFVLFSEKIRVLRIGYNKDFQLVVKTMLGVFLYNSITLLFIYSNDKMKNITRKWKEFWKGVRKAWEDL